MSNLISICLISILTINLLQQVDSLSTKIRFNRDVNDDKNCEQKFEQPKYKIFSSLTLYENSRKLIDDLISKKSSSSSSQVNNNNDNIVFGPKTIQEEHDDLISNENSCKPINFYFLGRHAARFPKDDKIENFNKNLLDIQAKLRLKLSNNQTNENLDCLEKFLNWKSILEPKQNYLITEIGSNEEKNIAKRFKQLYPEFFNINKSEIDLAVTSKIRTSMTGIQFMELVDGFNHNLYPNCEKIPTNDVKKPDFNPELINNDKCYKDLISKETEEFLQFHERCKKSLKKLKADHNNNNNNNGDKHKDPMIEKIKSPEATRKIAEKVSKKLANIEITSKNLDSIVKMCTYEIAILNESIWCSLLDESDLKLFEYITDTEAYIEDSYGPDSNIKQACPLISNIVNNFELAINELSNKKSAGSGSLLSDDIKKRAYFYFTHDHALKKVFPTFGLFKDNLSFNEKTIDKFIKDGEVPEDRNYKSALSVPFSGNIAFIIYRCQKDNVGNNNSAAIDYKLLTTLNERPIKIKINGNCNEKTVCDVKSFIDTYKTSKTDCNLSLICPL